LILQSLDALKSDLQSTGFRSCYLILGPEEYLCHAAVRLLRDRVLTPEAAPFDFCELAAPDTTVATILEAANTFPMLSKRRFVLVTHIDGMPDPEQDDLLESLPELSSRAMLILSATDIDHRKKFYRTLRDKGCVMEFARLKGVALERWAADLVRNQGYRVSANSIKRIVSLVGTDLQTLAAEMEKLLIHAGKEKNISDSAIDDLVRNSREHGIFELIAAIGNRNRSGALQVLANLLNTGEPLLVIVAMMARHCRQVLIAGDCLKQGMDPRGIGTAAQVPHFVLDQFLLQARAADLATVKKMYVQIAGIDRRLKSSSLDGRMLLEQVICSLV
jgi:DNA polymerase III subunit delta